MLIRYPGSKSRIKQYIVNELAKHIAYASNVEYREPFFGAGSICFELLRTFPKQIKKIWINDIDPGLICLWNAVIHRPELLKNSIVRYQPRHFDFYTFKKDLLLLNDVPNDTVKADTYGLKKLIIHQITYSGLGTKSGGPLGGAQQQSRYKINCRWFSEKLCNDIDEAWKLFNQVDVKCTCCGFQDLLIDQPQSNAVMYLDPPYYYKGNQLYQYGMSEYWHQLLANNLKSGLWQHPWVLSYDEAGFIRKLYEGYPTKEIDLKYTIRAKNAEIGKKISHKTELLICNKT
jgi:DNA adenine methylase